MKILKMEKLIYGVAILTLFSACKKQVNSTSQKTLQLEKTNPINDPNLFIGKHKTKVLILGIFHFDNPNLDSYKEKFAFNILEKKRQQELNVLLDKIAEYKPTKILLEWPRIQMDSIANNRYQNYLNGSFKLNDKKNEIYQIGFKLAKKLGHNRIYCSDASADWFGAELDWDNYDRNAYLKAKGQYEKSKRYDYESFYELSDSLKSVQTLTEHLALDNKLENRLKDHQAYLTEVVLEGAGDTYIGADAVARWYRRNMRIFANAYDFTNFDREERLMLIYGSGHVWQLRQLFTDSPDFDYVEANDYLQE